MFRRKVIIGCCAVVACLAAISSLHAQLGITGVTDKTVYPNTVTFLVSTQTGFSYGAYLNHKPVPVGVSNLINQPDFYELFAYATNQTTTAVTSRYVRFIVEDTSRDDTELGLPPQTPWPVIPSASNEFAGARLRLIVPQDFPAGYAIPVVAWVVDDDGHAVRANGVLAAGGHPGINLKRGVGSGFLAATNPPGQMIYAPSVQGLQTNRVINLESSTTWLNVAGQLSGNVVWPANSRIAVTAHVTIPAGSTLTIGEGTIVRLNSQVSITNRGAITINGTVDRPVVFMPVTHAQPWGGFVFPASTSELEATGTIFTHSGAGQDGYAGHRDEQHLFSLDQHSRLTLTDCAAIYLDGQFGHGFDRGQPLISVNLTRTLVQHCTTAGEYTGASFTVNDCAFIEFPDDTANFLNEDHDALYFVNGSHYFTNTLFGWTKDDGIDSGGSGYGPLTYQSCWFEATFHEGNSLSGFKNVYSRGTVYIDCGQGIEDGYDAPTGRVDNCLFTACKVGVRHGDNYQTFSGYRGDMIATNCLILYNHRDIFAFNWDNEGGWTNAYEYCFASNNWLTVADTNFPNNNVWNPLTDAARLGAFGGVGRVGVALAVRPGQRSITNFPQGLPVGLSRFCTNEVTVDYTLEGTDGTRAAGTLVFPAGLTRNHIPLPVTFNGVLHVRLTNPQNADITSPGEFLFQNLPSAGGVTLISRGAEWRYRDLASDPGPTWKNTNYNDGSWPSGLAQLGFSNNEEDDEATLIADNDQITSYFRQTFLVANPAAFTNLSMWLLRDDGGVVHLNGWEVFRSPNLPAPPAVISYTNTTSAPNGENTIDTATLSATNLLAGTNWAAVEIHQQSATSSDVSFDFELTGNPVASSPPLYSWRVGNDVWLAWSDSAFVLEQAAEITGSWSALPNPSPVVIVSSEQQRFFRLRRP